jgi:hypothetical protein
MTDEQERIYHLWATYRDRMMGEQWDFPDNRPSDSMDMDSAGIAAASLVLALIHSESQTR